MGFRSSFLFSLVSLVSFLLLHFSLLSPPFSYLFSIIISQLSFLCSSIFSPCSLFFLFPPLSLFHGGLFLFLSRSHTTGIDQQQLRAKRSFAYQRKNSLISLCLSPPSPSLFLFFSYSEYLCRVCRKELCDVLHLNTESVCIVHIGRKSVRA